MNGRTDPVPKNKMICITTTTFRCPARYLQTVVMPDVRGWYVRSRYDLRYWQESDSVGLPRRHVEHSD